MPGGSPLSVKLLRPINLHRDLPGPQCSEIVAPPTHNLEYRSQKLRGNTDCCQRSSAVEIDGRHYCRLHAGKIALARWVDGRLVER
jgi:hypothetical protein